MTIAHLSFFLCSLLPPFRFGLKLLPQGPKYLCSKSCGIVRRRDEHAALDWPAKGAGAWECLGLKRASADKTFKRRKAGNNDLSVLGMQQDLTCWT